MDKKLFEMQAEICRVFSNPKRIEIIYHLKEQEWSVNALSGAMGISQSNLSQHLTVMRNAGIIELKREGGRSIYKIANPKVLTACNTMRELLVERLAVQAGFSKKLKK